MNAEEQRLDDDRVRQVHWKRWGPYVSDRAWGTVREDYSPDGTAWEYLPHDHARSRAYRWNEDGLAGISDRHQEVCLALALWNGRDPILKERLFGLTGNEGNHGEDVKEYYFYLDSTPTHSYMRMLYKYPQAAFPYGSPGRREPAPRARRPGIRADRHRRLRRRPLLRRRRRVRQGRCRRPRDARHGDQSRPGSGADPRPAHRVVPQHLGLGPPYRNGRALGLRANGRTTPCCRSRRAGMARASCRSRRSRIRSRRRCWSPTTRPTSRACSAWRPRASTSRTASTTPSSTGEPTR